MNKDLHPEENNDAENQRARSTSQNMPFGTKFTKLTNLLRKKKSDPNMTLPAHMCDNSTEG